MRIPLGLRAAAGVPTGGVSSEGVVLLLHGNGTDGSTTFTDSSASPFTVTGTGDAQIDTSIVKYGTGSMQFDGTSDWLTVASSSGNAAFAGDFTFECWFYPESLVNNYGGIFSNASFNSGNEFTVLYRNTRQMYYRIGNTTVSPADQTGISASTWYHIAVTREGSTVRYFLDGTVSATTTTFAGSMAGDNDWVIGAAYANNPAVNEFTGYIDDLRIVEDTALYTSNFTPPTSELPDP